MKYKNKHVIIILFLMLCCETTWSQTDSINILRRKASAGDLDAMVDLGNCYFYGKHGITRNNDTANTWYRKAAERGNAKGMNNLGLSYRDGTGVDTNYELAIYWLQRSADMGYPKAQANLAVMHVLGLGMNVDFVEAERLAKLSANQDDAFGIYVLGYIYLYDSLITNDREAYNLFKRAVEKGDEASAYYVGLCYDEGKGVERNINKAVYWYKRGAEFGEPFAQIALGDKYFTSALGDKYFNGHGLASSKTRINLKQDSAVYWYRKAAEQGDIYSQKRLAYCYIKFKDNNDSAFCWYHKVAVLGDWEAQYEIAKMYENGLGVERNYDSACYWYYKVMFNSDNKAWDLVGSLEKLTKKKREERDSIDFIALLNKANTGDTDAMCEVGNEYSHDWNHRKDSLESIYWYKRAASLGCVKALYKLSNAYEKNANYAESERLLLQIVKKATNQGIICSEGKACKRLGDYFRYGLNRPKDDEKAVQWYMKAIHEGGYESLVEMSEKGIPAATKALKKIQKKASYGDTTALFAMGEYLLEKCKSEEGLQLLEQAWEEGSRMAPLLIADYYRYRLNFCIEKDSLLSGMNKEDAEKYTSEQYIKWMKEYIHLLPLEANGFNGYSGACFHLAMHCHKEGDDYTSTYYLFESSRADQVHFNTCFDLAYLYIYGAECLEQDFEKAVHYYQKVFGEKGGKAHAERVIGDYYEEMGDTLTAYCWYQSALTGYANGKTKDIEKEFNPFDAKEIKKLYDKIRYIKDHFTLPTEDLRRRRSSFPPKIVSPSTSKSTKITWFNWPEHPKDEIIHEKSFLVNALIESDNKILDYNITVNGKVVEAPATRGQKLSGQSSYERRLYTRVPVEPGMNILSINVVAEDGQAHSIKTITYKSLEKKQYVNGNKERRLALVIGNAKYPKDNSRFGPLSTTINDAKAIADQLEKLGFRVMRAFDVDIMSMWDSISLFGEMAPHYDVGLFYYAGHGVSLNGDNYLIPIRSECRDTVGLRNEAVPLNKVIEKMDDFSLKIIMLDACRDYFIQSRGIMERGLSDISPEGTLISFAASPGKTASEGKEHSPYTEAVLKMLKKGDVALLEFFSEVHDEVLSKTGQMQEPVWHSAVNKEGRKFCFNKR